MQSFLKFHAGALILIATIAALPAVGFPSKDKLIPVKAPGGATPRTSTVDEPHQAIEVWGRAGLRHRTLLLISERIGITPIDEKEAARVRQLSEKGDWGGLLSKDYRTPIHYPVNPGNYLYAAHEAGIIDKVYWVPPAKGSVGKEPLKDFKGFLKGMGVPESDLTGLKQTGDSIQGKLSGIPVYIYSMEDLPRLEEDPLLLIDLTFFTPFYENEVKTPLLDLFGGFINALGGKGIPVSEAVVSYSTDPGPVPLEYRFVGGYLRTYLTAPERLKDAPPKTWKLRAQAMYDETFFQTDEIVQSYVDAVKQDTEDASLRYALSSAFFSNKDLEGVRKELDQAVALDKGYYPAYVSYAKYFQSQKMEKDAEYFLLRASEVNPSDPEVWGLLHDIYSKSGRYKEAAEVLEKYIALGFNGPDMLWALGDTYLKQGEARKATKTFLDALAKIPAFDRSARYGLLLGLGDSYEQDRKVDKALQVYEDLLKTVDEPHSRSQVEERIARLKEKWAPFMGSPAPKPH